MRILIGVIFILTLSLVVVFILYLFLFRQKPKKKIIQRGKYKVKVKPKPNAKLESRSKTNPKLKLKASSKASFVRPQYRAVSGLKQLRTRARYDLPPEIPRDVNTMRIIAKEAPDIVIDVIRKWLREG